MKRKDAFNRNTAAKQRIKEIAHKYMYMTIIALLQYYLLNRCVNMSCILSNMYQFIYKKKHHRK